MAYLDRANPVLFAGIQIPYRRVRIRSTQRIALHKYPFIDAADLEALGRDPYTFTIEALFDENMSDFYPDNFPGTVNELQKKYEAHATDILALPRQGRLKAIFAGWEEVLDTMVRSGETATFEFIEAPDRAVVFSDLAVGQSFDQIDAKHSAVLSYVASLSPKVTVPQTLLDKLGAAVASFLALRDRGELYTQLAESRLLSLRRTIELIDNAITTPVGYQLIDALRDLWQAADKLVHDASLQGSLATWLTPKQMTIQQASIALYKNTSKVIELLQLNDTLDPHAIPANTTLVYFKAAS